MPDGSKIGGSTDPKRRHPDSESANPAPAAKRTRPQSPEVIDLTSISEAEPRPVKISRHLSDSHRTPPAAYKGNSSFQPAQLEQSKAQKMAMLSSLLPKSTYKNILSLNTIAPHLISKHLNELIYFAQRKATLGSRDRINGPSLLAVKSHLKSESGASKKTVAAFFSKFLVQFVTGNKRRYLIENLLSKPLNSLQEKLLIDDRLDSLIINCLFNHYKKNNNPRTIDTLLSSLHSDNSDLYHFLEVNLVNISTLYEQIKDIPSTLLNLDLFLAIGIKATRNAPNKQYNFTSLLNKSTDILKEHIFQSIRQSDNQTIRQSDNQTIRQSDNQTMQPS